MDATIITSADPEFPDALRARSGVPSTLTTSRPMPRDPGRVVGIVGSRDGTPESLRFAYQLSFQLARAGATVVSGGALGVDSAAHLGALDAGGATWVVAPSGRNFTFPPENEELFARVAASTTSRMIWPFADHVAPEPETKRTRNSVLVAFADAIVVVQAHLASGSRNAARWARELSKPLWVVPAAPWMSDFHGSLDELARGARPLAFAPQLFITLGLPPPHWKETIEVDLDRIPVGSVRRAGPRHGRAPAISVPPSTPPPEPLDTSSWTQDENLVFSRLSLKPTFVDEILVQTGLEAPSVQTALLTLSLKDVVVEGPSGHYRRRFAG